MYLDILVNVLIITILLSWLIFSKINKSKIRQKFKNYRIRRQIAAIIWIIFIASTVSTAVFYSDIKNSHDIDDAVEAASQNFLKGINPYKENVVPRFSEKYHGDNTPMKNSTYNYLPLSLFFYSVAYYFLGCLGSLWFPLTNLILGISVIFIASATFPKIPKKFIIPVIGTISLFFIFDNVLLAFLFLSMAFYFIVKSQMTYRYFFALLFLFLGIFVKFVGMVALAVFLLYLIQKYKFKRYELNLQILLFITIASLIVVPSFLYFGVSNVANSTIFYFSDVSIRSASSAYGGTFITFFLGKSPYFPFFTTGLLVFLILGSLMIKSLYEKLFLPEALLPFFTIQASHALLLWPAYSLIVLALVSIFPEFEISKESVSSLSRKILHTLCLNLFTNVFLYVINEKM